MNAKRHRRPCFAAVLVTALCMASLPASAGERDHERALRALNSGEAVPLSTVLARAEAMFTGKMIEVELEDDHGKLQYEVKMLTPDGRVLELNFDARNGEFLKAEGKNLERYRKKGD